MLLQFVLRFYLLNMLLSSLQHQSVNATLLGSLQHIIFILMPKICLLYILSIFYYVLWLLAAYEVLFFPRDIFFVN